MKADLHMHSFYSDGKLSPSALALLCKKSGIAAAALTDHDCVDGVSEMSSACGEFGIINVPGVELSTHAECDVHILGLGLDVKSPGFTAYLKEINAKKLVRLDKIVRLMNAEGARMTADAVLAKVKGSLSRSHIAETAVEVGFAQNVKECFSKYLGEGKSCFVPIEKSPPESAIEAVIKAGGIAVLAHPVRLKLSEEEAVRLIRQLKTAGLSGIEAVYKDASKNAEEKLVRLAEKEGLLVTCGGDFHDEARHSVRARELFGETASALGLVRGCV